MMASALSGLGDLGNASNMCRGAWANRGCKACKHSGSFLLFLRLLNSVVATGVGNTWRGFECETELCAHRQKSIERTA